jgi:Domain of unknown function (DUF4124)
VTFTSTWAALPSYTSPMKRRTVLALALVLAQFGAAAAWAQSSEPSAAAWKWRDATGRVTVSDTPPPNSVPDKDILVRPPLQIRARAAASAAEAGPKPTASLTTPRGLDPELEARRKKAADDQMAQQKAQEDKGAAVRAENCVRAKGHLAALADGQRIARTNAQGEREVLDDKGRAEEMQRARAVIASDCK